MLRYTAKTLGRDTDLSLITGDTGSGLVLGWDRLAYADEYSLLSWGRFPVDLSQ